MNQQSWETFRAVAEVGSISGAARVLNLSQSAVSQQIQQLESQYETHLLVRSEHGVRLTPAGEVLYRYAIKILTALDESHERIRGLSEGAPERIRVGASFTIAEYLLPELLTRLYRPRSHGRITVTMANSAAVLDLVLHQAVDVGLVERDHARRGAGLASDADLHLLLELPIDSHHCRVTTRTFAMYGNGACPTSARLPHR